MNSVAPSVLPAPSPTPAASAPARHRPVRWLSAVLLAAGLLVTGGAGAQPASSAAVLFKDADVPLGEKLLREHQCSACHARRVGGDGSAIYRPQGRIASPAALRGMVEQCNLELNLAMFPDEVTAVSAVLNRDHYRFR